jgi:hypothetical protein
VVFGSSVELFEGLSAIDDSPQTFMYLLSLKFTKFLRQYNTPLRVGLGISRVK